MARSEAGQEPAATLKMEEGAVFNEPWEAQALALSVKLQEEGHFTANEWANALGAEVKAAQSRGDPDDGTTYYRHVLAALERLVCKKGLASRESLERRRSEWENAYRATPHGEPVTLANSRTVE
jgi:nitrile hydratase accessory protein